MLKFYYTLWVDMVVYLRNKEEDNKIFFLPIVYMTGIFFFNIGAIIFTLLIFDINLDTRNAIYTVFPFMEIFSKKMMNIFIFFMVCCFFYLTIFRGNKIDRLIEKYPYKQGKMVRAYAITSICLFFLPLLLMYIKEKLC